MTIRTVVETMNAAVQYQEELSDFAKNAEPADKMLGPSQANHIANIISNLMKIVLGFELNDERIK